MMQAIRRTYGQHDWGPVLGDIEHARHECEQCGKVKPVKATQQGGYGAHGNEGPYYTGGGGGGPIGRKKTPRAKRLRRVGTSEGRRHGWTDGTDRSR